MSTPTAIILAAGKGKRMNSDLPKVAHVVAERPMVEWVAYACAAAGCRRIILVVGHGQDVIRTIFADTELGGDVSVEYAVQDEQLGTGHAVGCAAQLLESERASIGHDVVVLAGDGPLIQANTIRLLIDRHRSSRAAATLATSVIDDPSGYGRIVRDESGAFRAIVEHKNATDEQRKIREINPSYYCFDAKALFEALDRVERDPESEEYFITDVPGLLLQSGAAVEVIDAVPSEDVLSINTVDQLARVSEILRNRVSESNATPASATSGGRA